MNELLYTRVEDVVKAAEHLNKNSCFEYDFYDIVTYLKRKNMLSPVPLNFRRTNTFLDLENFRQHVYSQVVYASLILEDSNATQIKEGNTIPNKKDIFTTIHLPYLSPKPHIHDFFELIYVYDGECTLFFDTKEEILPTGTLCILAPNSYHYAKPTSNSLVLSINIRQSTFDKTFWNLLEKNNLLAVFFQQCLYNRQETNYLTFDIRNPEQYNPIIQHIFDESNIEDPYSNSMTISLVNLFFGTLLRNFGNEIQLYNDFSSTGFNQDFPLMLKYVQANYATVTLTSLSNVFHYSTVHISRMFKKNLNQTFSSVLQTLKLQHAQSFLRTTSYTLSQIAEMVGYDSPDHLSRIFKKMYHMAPSEYRKYHNFATEDHISNNNLP